MRIFRPIILNGESSNELFEAGVLFGLKDDSSFSESYGNYFNVRSIDLHGFNPENVTILMDVIGSYCVPLYGKQLIYGRASHSHVDENRMKIALINWLEEKSFNYLCHSDDGALYVKSLKKG